jgi:hypothetical protein
MAQLIWAVIAQPLVPIRRGWRPATAQHARADREKTTGSTAGRCCDATGPVGESGKGQFERIAKDYDRVSCDRISIAGERPAAVPST